MEHVQNVVLKKVMEINVRQCGTSHNGTDLINPKSAITGNTPTLKKTKHWFLTLDKHRIFFT